MNIFILHEDQLQCAEYHCDKHVVKMLLETCQMLSTVCHEHGMTTTYKPVHKKHPCTKWAGRSLSNWKWLLQLGFCLHSEYVWRYEPKIEHKCYKILQELEEEPPDLIDFGLTEFAQAMPDQYKNKDVVKAYRNYYMHEKAAFATWKHPSKKPRWFKEVKHVEKD